MTKSRALIATLGIQVRSTNNRGPIFLSLSQMGVLLLSTLVFAILARMLGPGAFGEFAGIIFVFGVSSLLADLAPQAFLLVHGISERNYSAARLCALISWTSSSALLLIMVALYRSFSSVSSYDFTTCLLLVVGLACQFGMQPPRALMVVGHRYGALAFSDIFGTFLGSLVAVLLAMRGVGGLHVLTVQLVLSLAVRQLMVHISIRISQLRPARAVGDSGSSLREGIRFGISVIPLNVGSYLTRSLDSGLMPLLLPHTVAGVYARSYQLVVVPVSQLQLAVGPWVLGRLGGAVRDNRQSNHPIFVKVWLALSTVSTAAALAISLTAPLIASIVFGHGWSHADLMLTCMAATLPSLACNTYFAWMTQVFPRKNASIAHLGAVLIAPVSALVGAGTAGLAGALIALVGVGGLLQPVVLSYVHREVLPASRQKFCFLIFFQWLVPASLFLAELIHTGNAIQ